MSLNSAAFALTFISQGWVAVRDLANIGLIFILLYTGFIVMLRGETSGTMQVLARVVVIALIINFSFFLTRVAIDAGNVVAVQFYNSISAQSIQTTVNEAGVGSTAANWLGIL